MIAGAAPGQIEASISWLCSFNADASSSGTEELCWDLDTVAARNRVVAVRA